MTDIVTSQAKQSASIDYDIETAVIERYQAGAKQQQPSFVLSDGIRG